MSKLARMYRNDTDVPFPQYWKRVLIASTVLVLISVLALLLRGFNLGLEFEGGAAWEVPSNSVSADEARDTLSDLGLSGARIQTGGGVLRVRAELDVEDPKVTEVSIALAALTGSSTNDVSFSTAGPSWGDEITRKAVKALIWFFIAIALYMTLRLRWQMAVGALVAVAHDLVITAGFYALVGALVTPSTVIAFLTIMGYSLYDTMVVFDKVRDNEFRMVNSKATHTDIMNVSLNQVLMRSINTSITSVLPVLSVLIVGSVFMGAVSLREFAIALLLGLIFGTYSSLFVAAPIATWLRERSTVTDATSSRQYRLSDAIKRRSSTSAPSSVPGDSVIPARPRKQKRR